MRPFKIGRELPKDLPGVTCHRGNLQQHRPTVKAQEKQGNRQEDVGKVGALPTWRRQLPSFFTLRWQWLSGSPPRVLIYIVYFLFFGKPAKVTSWFRALKDPLVLGGLGILREVLRKRSRCPDFLHTLKFPKPAHNWDQLAGWGQRPPHQARNHVTNFIPGK